MTTKLQLFVYVIGLGSPSFSIGIQSSETVHNLKKAIINEKQNGLRSIDPDQLSLFKVKLDDTDDIETLETSASTAIHSQKKLGPPSRMLSKEFLHQPESETVSVVVMLPERFQKGECVHDLSGRQFTE